MLQTHTHPFVLLSTHSPSHTVFRMRLCDPHGQKDKSAMRPPIRYAEFPRKGFAMKVNCASCRYFSPVSHRHRRSQCRRRAGAAADLRRTPRRARSWCLAGRCSRRLVRRVQAAGGDRACEDDATLDCQNLTVTGSWPRYFWTLFGGGAAMTYVLLRHRRSQRPTLAPVGESEPDRNHTARLAATRHLATRWPTWRLPLWQMNGD